MRQKAEQDVWKPVLGTLGVASVLLPMVGSLVFSPDSPLKKWGSATGGQLAATSFPQSLDPPQADSEPVSVFHQAVEPSSIPKQKLPDAPYEAHARLAPKAELPPQVEVTAAAERAPQVELLPKTDQSVVTLPVSPRYCHTRSSRRKGRHYHARQRLMFRQPMFGPIRKILCPMMFVSSTRTLSQLRSRHRQSTYRTCRITIER